MNPDQWMAAARKRQGLPPTITDRTALARLASLIQLARRRYDGQQSRMEDAA